MHIFKLKASRFMIFILLAGIIIISWHNVDKNISKEDITTIEILIAKYGLKTNNNNVTFEEQIDQIKKVQNAVLDISPTEEGIPELQSRNIYDLYTHGQGVCYDRSRAIEQTLKYLGFKTKHAFIIYGDSTLRTPNIFQTNAQSHAILEVKTKKGWLVVGSNNAFIALDTSNKIYNAHQLKGLGDLNNYKNLFLSENLNELYAAPYSVVYGLYSRHGKFYPPYNIIPDYNFRELLYNF